jgi:2-polyprenyl-3-methyl-5-hydroxy-6-metoxy-1,4-benzoquinol methylase
MQYEPIKRSLGKFFSGPLFVRRTLYFLIDLLLLRTWHVKKALRKMAKQIPENSEILDAGSGLGQYAWRMSQMNRNWIIKGVDIDNVQVEDCNNFFSRAGKGERVKFSTADLTTFMESGKYNLILSVDVMEHIKDDEQVFHNFYHSLKPGGRLLLSTPSDRGGSDVHEHGDESYIDEHVRNGYGSDEIKQKLTKAGFSNISVRYTYGLPGKISWRLSMKYPVKMLNISYIFFIILPFYYLVVFPFCIVLNFLDIGMDHSEGTGLLVSATK